MSITLPRCTPSFGRHGPAGKNPPFEEPTSIGSGEKVQAPGTRPPPLGLGGIPRGVVFVVGGAGVVGRGGEPPHVIAQVLRIRKGGVFDLPLTFGARGLGRVTAQRRLARRLRLEEQDGNGERK